MHIPVLLKETIDLLNPQPNQNFVDGTLGEGGHSAAILERTTPHGKLLGIDLNTGTLKIAQEKLTTDKLITDRLILVQGNFSNIKEITRTNEFITIHGILLDLGLSSRILEQSGRGFSFQRDEPLDMRYGEEGVPAVELVNQADPETLERILTEYGEEPHARSIVKSIIHHRQQKPIITTFDLVKAIEAVAPRRGKIHPATRTFQALRIAVNRELEILEHTLRDSIDILAPHGRLAVISYHSLEDRIVKTFLKTHTDSLIILTKKPIVPSKEELQTNPRSRSAKLRVAEKK